QALDNGVVINANDRLLKFNIQAGGYSILPASSASIQLSEGDLQGSVSVPKPLATRQLVPGLSVDPDSNRRGIINFNLPSSQRTWTTFLNVQLGGSAALGTDYTCSYRVGPDGNSTASASNGLGYTVTAYLAGEGLGTAGSSSILTTPPGS